MAAPPIIRAGELRHRVTIEEAATSPTPDAYGGTSPAEEWTAVGDRSASVTPLSGLERIEAAAVAGEVSHLVRIRAEGTRPTSRARVRLGDRLLYVVAVLDVGERLRVWELHCREEGV